MSNYHRYAPDRPPYTRLVREWQGVEHVVTVMADGYEWQGRPYKALSAAAGAITGMEEGLDQEFKSPDAQPESCVRLQML